MRREELQFSFPEELIATEPQRPSRVLWVQNAQAQEISIQDLLNKIPAGDILVVNDTRVLKRRVFVRELEILFLGCDATATEWEVLFPSRRLKVNDHLTMPNGVVLTLLAKGRPQKIKSSRALTEKDFDQWAELPLPPYIQKARQERHQMKIDESWYQTAWASAPGSLAAPTASLHFSNADLAALEKKGVIVAKLTLHVGLGTFLPVTAEDLQDHDMHSEWVSIPGGTWQEIQKAKQRGAHVWALGTTVTRSLESAALGMIPGNAFDGFHGATNLLILPGFSWQVVDVLMTNFHQPESTLLALVAAFTDLTLVRQAYQLAVEKKFRLFSYGDLSVWFNPRGKK